MAETVSLQSKLSFTGTSGTYTNVTTSSTFTPTLGTLSKAHHTTQSVGLSKELLSTGDVTLTAQHVIRLENKDPDNFVTVYLRLNGTPTDEVAGIMLPGEPYGPVRVAPQSGGYPCYYMLADTAACNVEVVVSDG